MKQPEYFNHVDSDNLPGYLGIKCLEIARGHSLMCMTLTQHHLNLRGYIHGGSIVTLADTAAGYATHADLPEDAKGFTTIELKTNFLRSLQQGELFCRASRIHHGRTTQVWDATVFTHEDEKTIAEFRCTQMVFY